MLTSNFMILPLMEVSMKSGEDQSPIIEQDVMRVGHRDTVDDLVRKWRDLEEIVLARAVRHHVERRVLVYGRKTVVFD